jgi:hypothetical protein
MTTQENEQRINEAVSEHARLKADRAREVNLAREFSKVLREWLTPSQMAEVIRRNATPEYADGLCCASHDFCDANMAMDAALRVNYADRMTGDWVTEDDELRGLWNSAWDIAKSNGFTV